MNRHIALVVKKMKLNEEGNDFAYWQSQPYEARLVAMLTLSLLRT
jgi:hypothetical protein